MDPRKVFDLIPEQFDRGRTTYCPQAFADMIAHARLGPGASALEIGPGTGQATEPVLATGCDYLAIELGEHLADFCRSKFAAWPNFSIECGDFETHDFGARQFDLVYSAATIQWIPEQIGFSRAFALTRPGGTFAMMLTRTDERSADPELYSLIRKAYDLHFVSPDEYTCRLNYRAVTEYGFEELELHEYPVERILTAEEYIGWMSTHCTHIRMPEPNRTRFFDAVREAIASRGGRITLRDTVVLYLTKRPL